MSSGEKQVLVWKYKRLLLTKFPPLPSGMVLRKAAANNIRALPLKSPNQDLEGALILPQLTAFLRTLTLVTQYPPALPRIQSTVSAVNYNLLQRIPASLTW